MHTTNHSHWRSRDCLPHVDRASLIQMITYRLADSVPASVLDRLKATVAVRPRNEQSRARCSRIDDWSDAGYGSCVLERPEVTDMVVENWRNSSGSRYDLIVWTVMPNHVHLLVKIYDEDNIGRIVQSWKTYMGKRDGSVWSLDYWNRYIRNEEHFENAVKAGLLGSGCGAAG